MTAPSDPPDSLERPRRPERLEQPEQPAQRKKPASSKHRALAETPDSKDSIEPIVSLGSVDPDEPVTKVRDPRSDDAWESAVTNVRHPDRGADIDDGRIEIVAHRGAGAGFTQPAGPPENTLPALAAAFAHGADACEIDVHLSRDGRAVVIHDPTLGRTGSDPADRAVAELTWDELSAVDVGAWKGPAWAGTTLPSLLQVLEATPPGARIYIEVKPGPHLPPDAAIRAVADDIAAVASERGESDHPDVSILSFDLATCVAAATSLPECPRYLLVDFAWDSSALYWIGRHHETAPEGFLDRVYAPADDAALVSLCRRCVDAGLTGLDVSARHPEPLAQAARDVGLAWAAWTVDDPVEILALAQRGANSITTNHPAVAHAVLARAGLR
jgi:glycerophosphoryl diester phosphodiesterase